MKKIFNLLFAAFISLLFCDCSDIQSWEDERDNIAPGSISDPIVENKNGGAKITYNLPPDDDLLGVKAIYTTSEDSFDKTVTFASAFNNCIEIIGLPDTEEREIELICLDRSKNESEPVYVKIQPLTPPIHLVFNSLEVNSTFGGLAIDWKNPSNLDLGISLYVEDSTGVMQYDYTYFTNETNGNYAFRGFDSEEKKIQIQLHDKWNNYSQIKDTVIKPLFEEQIESVTEFGVDIWRRYGYDDRTVLWRGDAPHHRGNRDFSMMIDGIYGRGDSGDNYLHTNIPGHMLGFFTENEEDEDVEVKPIYITVDLGRLCNLSRHKLWHRTRTTLTANNLKSYEIWASKETPKQPEDFDTKMESLAYWTQWPEIDGTDAWKNDWDKIATCDVIPPSGATHIVDVTGDDKEWAKDHGFEFDIDPTYNNKPYRYLRFVVNDNWGGGSILHIGEIQFWGAYFD